MSSPPELVVAEGSGGPCASCGAANCKFKCSGCFKAWYCSEDHRAGDYENHKKLCDKPYKILKNEEFGRYVVANRDLEPGEELWSETAFVVGPKAFSYPLCLGCYSPWPPTGLESTERPLCSKCGWPVCGPDCELLPCHKDYECQVFAASGEKFNVIAAIDGDTVNASPQLDCVSPLRLLIASEKDPIRWMTEVKDMEAHNLKRSQQLEWKRSQVNIVEYLRSRCKLDRFSEDELHTACGILEINSHEVRSPSGYSAKALYPITAMMNHSCVSNTTHSISPDNYRICVRTTTKVQRGSELYGSYTHSLLPTILRREQLRESKYFDCACRRCSDPTELGTHMSSLKCNKCDNGVILSLDSLDPESTWKCTHCPFTTGGQAIRRVLSIIQAEVDDVEQATCNDGGTAIEARESLIKKYRSVLHPQHAFNISLMYSLNQLYGRCEGYEFDDLPDVVLEHKVDICRSLLRALDVIEPGYSRFRGMTLYELHAPLLVLAKNLFHTGTIDEASLKSKMIEAAEILKEAARILMLEYPNTVERQIGEVAVQSLGELEASIKNT
ncbi:SET domain-containing protein SmydA-8-like [Neodiprion virginianus]|uniref:SET domain-containing protein SmydA-8-like n=1 Tax=Neodiprion virginianus TaxID=2961670 RepID=UPI001EE75821|nr:SET domain-containing protein SmydA-8-like [Neodiprion virginianus]